MVIPCYDTGTLQALKMAKVNYIQHLNAVLEQFRKDNRLNTAHISLYIALFQLWNHHRFRASFQVNRQDVMEISKIGSKSTYHRCVKDLSNYKYLIYEPSHNPFKGSIIKMLNFSSCKSGNFLNGGQESMKNNTVPNSRQVVGQAVDLTVPNQGQAVGRYNKHIQTNKNSYKLPKPKNEKEVLEFFKKEKWPEIEAQKFYNHYQTIGWKIGGKIKIENWQACAKNWMIKHRELSARASHNERSRDARTKDNRLSQNQDKLISRAGNLHTKRNKNYNEPL